MLEIERKFLLTVLPPGWTADSPHQIDQGYLAVEPNGTHVRLRRRDDTFTLTAKRGRGHVREEFETELEAGQFDILWPLTAGRRLRKLRYLIPHGDLKFEVDVFQGRHEGLIVAEIEFPDVERSRTFSVPGWCGQEVTSDPDYSNIRLAVD